MRYFRINEWSKFRYEFHRLFRNNIPIIDLYDGLFSFVNDRLTIDIVALDKRLELMYPEDYPNMSMKEIIIKHYGLEAMDLIESVL